MKLELGRCLLEERIGESGFTIHSLAAVLKYKPERLTDYIENRRVMPLKTAINIAHTLDCEVAALYELIGIE